MNAESAAAGILFIASGTNAMDVFSATNSSPWTGFKFANDEESVKALRYYVNHAIAMTAIMNVGGAIIAKSWLPVFGATIMSVYMYWLYEDAIKKGTERGSTSWQAEGKSQ